MGGKLMWIGVVIVFPLISMMFMQEGFSRNRKPRQVPSGMWGGEHIRLEVAGRTASIEYDCAHGTITQPLALDRRGHFDARGTHVMEHGGPIRKDEQSDSRPARYTGWTDGKRMTLKVTLTDTDQVLGTFNLVHGERPRIVKCR